MKSPINQARSEETPITEVPPIHQERSGKEKLADLWESLIAESGISDDEANRILKVLHRPLHTLLTRSMDFLIGMELVAKRPFSTQREAVDTLRLTLREVDILNCLIEGLSNKRIAKRLEITTGAVKVSMKALMRKVEVRNRTEAAIWAQKNLS